MKPGGPAAPWCPGVQAPPSLMLALTWEEVSVPEGATVRSCWEKFIISLGQPGAVLGCICFELILSVTF